MSRYTSGYVLVAGLMVAAFGIAVSFNVTQAEVAPDKDWIMDLFNYGGIASALAGMAMFFLGALRFSKPE